MGRAILVDGTYELFRMYFGAPPSKNAAGEEVGACRALFQSLRTLAKRDDVSHVAVAFDHVIESFRNELFAGYKTGAGIEEALFSQFPIAEEVAGALGLAVWPMVRFEADDGLASGAALLRAETSIDQVVLASPDKDLAQAVRGSRVITWDRRRDETRDEDGVWEKFGVGPASIPDYLALVGDTADGIPGIARWGAKSTATVLAHYGSIDAIPDDPGAWAVKVRGAAALAANLADARDDARLYRTLATLREDALSVEPDLPTPAVDDLRYRGPDAARMAAVRLRLGMG